MKGACTLIGVTAHLGSFGVVWLFAGWQLMALSLAANLLASFFYHLSARLP